MKIKDTIWFTTGRGETVGIVLAEDDVTGIPKAYIGVGDGRNEDVDIKQISEWGAKLQLTDLAMIQKHFIVEDDIEHLRRTAG